MSSGKVSAVAADAEGEPQGKPSSAVEKVVQVLELLAQRPDGVAVREAARASGIDRSSLNRILGQLETLGLARKDPVTVSYLPGPVLFSLASTLRARDTLWQAARPIVQALVAEHNETAYFAVRRHDRVVFQEKVECTHPVRYVLELGIPYPLPTGAAGMAILSALPDDEVAHVLSEGVPRYTSRTITDIEALREEVSRFRTLGYAVSVGRWTRDGAGVAAAVRDADGECVGAIALTLPATRFSEERLPKIARSVVAGAVELSNKLGAAGSSVF